MSYNLKLRDFKLIQEAAEDGNLVNQSQLDSAVAESSSTLNASLDALSASLAAESAARAQGDIDEAAARASDVAALQGQISANLATLTSLQVSWRHSVVMEANNPGDDIPAEAQVVGNYFIVGQSPVNEFAGYAGHIAKIESIDSGLPTFSFTNEGEGVAVYDQQADVIKLRNDSGEFVEVARFLGDDIVYTEELNDAIAAEVTARTAADATLQSNIDSLSSTASADRAAIRSEFAAADAVVQGNLDAVESAAAADRTAIRSEFAAADSSLNSQIQANLSAITSNDTDIATNATGIATNAAAISTETSRATAAEAGLQANIDNLAVDVQTSIDDNAAASTQEANQNFSQLMLQMTAKDAVNMMTGMAALQSVKSKLYSWRMLSLQSGEGSSGGDPVFDEVAIADMPVAGDGNWGGIPGLDTYGDVANDPDSGFTLPSEAAIDDIANGFYPIDSSTGDQITTVGDLPTVDGGGEGGVLEFSEDGIGTGSSTFQVDFSSDTPDDWRTKFLIDTSAMAVSDEATFVLPLQGHPVSSTWMVKEDSYDVESMAATVIPEGSAGHNSGTPEATYGDAHPGWDDPNHADHDTNRSALQSLFEQDMGHKLLSSFAGLDQVPATEADGTEEMTGLEITLKLSGALADGASVKVTNPSGGLVGGSYDSLVLDYQRGSVTLAYLQGAWHIVA